MATNALMLVGWEVHDVKHTMSDGRVALATYGPVTDTCPKCGSIGRLYRHGTKIVDYRDTPAFGAQFLIRCKVQRFRCRDCSETFMQPLPDMDSRRQMTKRCVAYIEEQGVHQTFAALSRQVGVDEKTVRNICHTALDRRMAERHLTAPTVLGIDELTLLGRRRTIFVDVGTRRPLDIIDSMERRRVERWLYALPNKDRIRAVTIDMWGPYKNAVNAYLPRAKVVVDKWHVVSKVNFALDRVRNRVRRAGPSPNRNPRKGKLLLQTSRHRLSEGRMTALNALLANSPILKAAWQTKEDFYDIWSAKSKQEAKDLFCLWAASLDPLVAVEFQPIVKMILNWTSEIFAYFDYPITNAYTESVNGRIKELNRSGRGYSFESIRAKALLMPPGRMRKCPSCLGVHPEGSFRAPVWEGMTANVEVCGNCHYAQHDVSWTLEQMTEDEIEEFKRNSTFSLEFSGVLDTH